MSWASVIFVFTWSVGRRTRKTMFMLPGDQGKHELTFR